MTIFFTSDYHFDHKNIIRYCKRPFKSISEMNEEIIKRHNEKVSNEDIVYNLGDFAFCDANKASNFARQLNGTIYLLKGNHDKRRNKPISHNIKHLDHYYELKVDDGTKRGQLIVLCHYAFRVWNKSHRGAYHLYGHSHGSLSDDKNALSFDVGVDCHNFYPVSFKEVQAIMNKKEYKPIDHHGKKITDDIMI